MKTTPIKMTQVLIHNQWQIQDFPWGAREPLTQALFTKNVCKNERIGSCRGGMRWACPPPDLPMIMQMNLKMENNY